MGVTSRGVEKSRSRGVDVRREFCEAWLSL
jgi:hypothetical protein